MTHQEVYDKAYQAATMEIVRQFACGDQEHPFNCGFAWVVIKGNTSFGRWAKKNKLCRQNYPKGMAFWGPGDWPTSQEVGTTVYAQDMTFKYNAANAFADVLRDNDIECYVNQRLD